MKYCVVINCPPSSPASTYAFEFCRALLRQNHELTRVFFHSAGVLHGSMQDEAADRWSKFFTTEILCCSASAAEYLENSDKLGASLLHPDFQLAGLGQLIEAEALCDRVISFGGSAQQC